MITKVFLPKDIPIYNSIFRCLPIGLFFLLIRFKKNKIEFNFKILLVSIFNISLFQYLLFFSAYRLYGGIASILTSTQVIFVILLSVPLLNSKITLRSILGTIFGFVGVIALLFNKGINFDIYGYLSALFAAISMALGTIFTKKWFQDSEILELTALQLTLGSIVLIPIALVSESFPQELQLNSYIAYFWLSIFGSGISYLLWFFGIKYLKIQIVTMLGFLSPISASLLGYFFLDEYLGFTELVGILLIVVSILFIQKTNTFNYNKEKHE